MDQLKVKIMIVPIKTIRGKEGRKIEQGKAMIWKEWGEYYTLLSRSFDEAMISSAGLLCTNEKYTSRINMKLSNNSSMQQRTWKQLEVIIAGNQSPIPCCLFSWLTHMHKYLFTSITIELSHLWCTILILLINNL